MEDRWIVPWTASKVVFVFAPQRLLRSLCSLPDVLLLSAFVATGGSFPSPKQIGRLGSALQRRRLTAYARTQTERKQRHSRQHTDAERREAPGKGQTAANDSEPTLQGMNRRLLGRFS